jgi:hypothetical protein
MAPSKISEKEFLDFQADLIRKIQKFFERIRGRSLNRRERNWIADIFIKIFAGPLRWVWCSYNFWLMGA